MSYRGRTGPGCAVAGFLLLAIGCTGGTETGNPPFVAALSYTGTSSAPDSFGVREGGRVATIQRAWLDLDAVQLSTEGTCGGEGQPLEVPALGVGDHAAGAHVETSFEAQPSRFCRVTLPFSRTTRLPEGAPPELEGRSVLLLGALADGTPFGVASSAEPRFELLAPSNGIRLSSEESSLLVAFDFAAWLSAVSLDGAERVGGAVRIDDEHNPALLAAFEAALGDGVLLYRDRDSDGVIDEGAEPLARAR